MTIKNFKEWLLITKGYSEKTINNYIRTLNKFDKYLKDISFNQRGVEQCEKIKIHDIESFISIEKLHGLETRTLNNYLSGIKTYIIYCAIHGEDVLDTRQIIFAKEHKKKIEALSEEECEKLFNHFKKRKAIGKVQELIKTRDLLIVSMFLYTGIRVSELAGIRIKDIQENMQVIGKGGERRTVNILPEEMKLIKLYLFMREDSSEWLFISHSSNSRGRKLSHVSIQEIIRKGGKEAGLDHKIYPHMLRHTFATLLLRKKANLYHIQQLLGHKNLNTTQIYLSVLNKELEETQKKIPRFS